ncbi:hypothetical protein ACT3TQ_10945 [Halomonas sp. AOP12-C2-37]|uniref:hypothetical protein n=1 Tax=unclassified Halomonas TaxID=2609666 RepID=UPI0040347218
MDCFGDDARERMVRRYNITAVAHVKLLNNQRKHSCTGRVLKDSYYYFEYKGKKDNKDVGAFYCGVPTAKKFLALTGGDDVPRFNPLKSDSLSIGSNSLHTGSATRKVDPATKQLLNAINLLVVCWDTAPYGKLAKIKQDRTKYSYRPPFDSEVEYVNLVIGYDHQGRNLQQMIDSLRLDNPNLKSYDFGLLNAVLKSTDVESSFG